MQLRANIWVGFQDCSSMRRNERGYSGLFWASDSKVQIFLSKKQNNTSCCTVVLFKVDGWVCVGDWMDVRAGVSIEYLAVLIISEGLILSGLKIFPEIRIIFLASD